MTKTSYKGKDNFFNNKTKLLTAIVVAVGISAVVGIGLLWLAWQSLASFDLNLPRKYIFLGFALLFLFVIWLFIRKKPTYTTRITSRSTIPWYKDWWVSRLLVFLLFAVLGAYLVYASKNSSWKINFGKKGAQTSSFSPRSHHELYPRKNIFLYAGAEYLWSMNCCTEYYFDLANPGEVDITFQNKDYPEEISRQRLINKDGRRYFKILSGEKPMTAGEYIVTVNQNTLINLRQVKVSN